jgi:hypothetical protein
MGRDFGVPLNQRSGRTDQSQRDNSQIGKKTTTRERTVPKSVLEQFWNYKKEQQHFSRFWDARNEWTFFSNVSSSREKKNVQNVSVTKINASCSIAFFSLLSLPCARGDSGRKPPGKSLIFPLYSKDPTREKKREKLESRSPCTWRTSHQRS